MSKQLGWLLGVVVLVSVGVLVACGSKYNSSSDGLLLVGSQGSGLIETFSFNLGKGTASAVDNTPADTVAQTCVLNGLPSSLVVDPAGAYAYTIINANTVCDTSNPPVTSKSGILAFKINSSGTTTAVGSVVGFNPETVFFQGTTTVDSPSPAVVPGTMVMDPAGKFLFVADRATTDSNGLYVPGAVSVFTIGSGGSVTEVPGSPFFVTNPAMTLPQQGLDIVSVAATPTVFPAIGINGVQNAVCSEVGLNPPSSQYLYAVDQLGGQVYEFTVNSSGVLSLSAQTPVPADALPAGIAVDPCDRFVYVSGSKNDKVSAYTICNGTTTQSTSCPMPADGSLHAVAGSPFPLTGSVNGPGPIVVDAYGNFVYVVGTLSNTVSPLRISPVSGALSSASTTATVATGQAPKSIAIRSDDSWMFVANYNSASVSQYAITPATGTLTVEQTITTDNYPWGVAVK